MHKKFILVTLLVITLLLSGCSANNGKVEKKDSNENTELLGKYKVNYVAVDSKSTANEIIDILDSTNKKNIANKYCEIVAKYSVENLDNLNCGEIYFNDGDMIEEFENAVKSLSVGEYTKEAVYSPNYELYYVIYRAQ